MPKIDAWDKLPRAIREHLISRLHDRKISLADLNELRLWIEASPSVPEGEWYKDFETFKICGKGSLPKTFLLRGRPAKGERL